MATETDKLENPGWRWRNSAWIIATAAPMGFLTWAAFLYAGVRAHRRGWQAAAVGYFVAFVIGITMMPGEGYGEGPRDDVAVLLILAVWAGGFVHALLIREDFLRTVAASPSSAHPEPDGDMALSAPDARNRGSGPAAAMLGLEDAQEMYFGSDTPDNVEPQGGQPTTPLDVPPASEDRDGRLSLAEADESSLAALPGMDAILAKRVVAERRSRGRFRSVDELVECGVPPHVVVRLRDLLSVGQSTDDDLPAGGRRGRTLDI